jgi:hypothetical protein
LLRVVGLAGARELTVQAAGLEAVPQFAQAPAPSAFEPGRTLTVHTAEPGSPSEERLRLLASLAATQEAGTATEPSR